MRYRELLTRRPLSPTLEDRVGRLSCCVWKRKSASHFVNLSHWVRDMLIERRLHRVLGRLSKFFDEIG